MAPVNSSALSAVGFSTVDSSLWLEYKNGRLYRYEDVPELVHARLMNSPSLGEYVNEFIKPRFHGIEITY